MIAFMILIIVFSSDILYMDGLVSSIVKFLSFSIVVRCYSSLQLLRSVLYLQLMIIDCYNFFKKKKKIPVFDMLEPII